MSVHLHASNVFNPLRPLILVCLKPKYSSFRFKYSLKLNAPYFKGEKKKNFLVRV